MSKAILLWVTTYLIWICSSFKAWMAFVLSRRACFVKLVKASTLIIISVVPIEGMNKAAIYSYHWNTDLVHLACKYGWFTGACCRLGFCYTGIYIKCSPMTRVHWLQVLHQEIKERLWLTRERKVSFCHPRKEQSGLKSPWQSGDTHQGSPSITDRGIASHTQQLEVLWKSA